MTDFAYFCAKCKNEPTDPTVAENFARKLGLTLWIPADEVEFDFPVGAKTCRDAIDQSACVICQPPIGNDCSWELGYALGIGKPVYVLGSLPGDDWMTKIGVRSVDPVSLTVRHPDERQGTSTSVLVT